MWNMMTYMCVYGYVWRQNNPGRSKTDKNLHKYNILWLCSPLLNNSSILHGSSHALLGCLWAASAVSACSLVANIRATIILVLFPCKDLWDRFFWSTASFLTAEPHKPLRLEPTTNLWWLNILASVSWEIQKGAHADFQPAAKSTETLRLLSLQGTISPTLWLSQL